MNLTIPDELLENNKILPPKINKLSHLKDRNCVVGNSDDLVHIDWSGQWEIPRI